MNCSFLFNSKNFYEIQVNLMQESPEKKSAEKMTDLDLWRESFCLFSYLKVFQWINFFRINVRIIFCFTNFSKRFFTKSFWISQIRRCFLEILANKASWLIFRFWEFSSKILKNSPLNKKREENFQQKNFNKK